MRELPEPEGQLAWQTYTRDQVLAVQKQAYEDALRDAATICKRQSQKEGYSEEALSIAWSCEMDIHSMLTASQKRDE